MSTGQTIFWSITGTAALLTLAFLVFDYIRELKREIANLKEQMGICDSAANRIKKHNGYNENKAYEDLIALLTQDAVSDEMEKSARRGRIETALAILMALRHDPRKYNPDKSLEDYLKERSNL